VIGDLDLPNPVIRSHYGNGFLKQYVRDHLLLRTEPASNNVADYGVRKAIENLPELRKKISAVIDNYHNVQQDILETFVDRRQLRKLAQPTVMPNGKRIPGLMLDHPRQLANPAVLGTAYRTPLELAGGSVGCGDGRGTVLHHSYSPTMLAIVPVTTAMRSLVHVCGFSILGVDAMAVAGIGVCLKLPWPAYSG
jgi:hypothetical protein